MPLLNNFNYKQLTLNILFCSLGCLACYYLQIYFSLSNVLSSILVGLVASFIPKFDFFDSNKAIAAIYCGSFASMSGLNYFRDFWSIFTLGLIVGLNFTICSPYFRGIGGKLGTIAFISAVTFIFWRVL